ncbi:hypothetical protein ABKN59_001475 [Abortiporus biennis]
MHTYDGFQSASDHLLRNSPSFEIWDCQMTPVASTWISVYPEGNCPTHLVNRHLWDAAVSNMATKYYQAKQIWIDPEKLENGDESPHGPPPSFCTILNMICNNACSTSLPTLHQKCGLKVRCRIYEQNIDTNIWDFTERFVTSSP